MGRYAYPGVYVEEVPSAERTVTGVSTSVTAFVGYTARGKLNEAVRIQNYGDFSRTFGGPQKESEVDYAVRQYFLNGGSEAYIVRTASGATPASVTAMDPAGSQSVLTFEAASEGAWGNEVRIQTDYATSNPDSFFNLTVSEYRSGTDSLLNQETFRNLSMNPSNPNYAPAVIGASSRLIQATSLVDPATVGIAGWSESGDLSAFPTLTDSDRTLKVSVNGEGPYEVALFPPGGSIASLTELQTALSTALVSASPSPAFQNAMVDVVGTSHIKVTSGVGGVDSSVVITAAPGSGATAKLKLGVAAGGREFEAASSLRPAQTGTVSGEIGEIGSLGLLSTDKTTVVVTVGGIEVSRHSIALNGSPTTLSELASLLQEQIRSAGKGDPMLKGLTVRVVGKRLVTLPSAKSGDTLLTYQDGTGESLAGTLDLNGGGNNVPWYSLGSPFTVGAQAGGTPGQDGESPGAAELIGSEATKTGIYALENVEMFNILCVPRMANLSAEESKQIVAEAAAYCERRRAFLIVDPPSSVRTRSAMEDWAQEATRSPNAAAYFPQVLIGDPLSDYRLTAMPASGTIAGIYARTDAERGVWKAPAGVEATLAGVQGLTYTLTDAENGVLNTLGVNCLRTFPLYGKVSWGARTLAGADDLSSEWKYIPVRRLALYIEESLYRGTHWAVFEPNDEQLWSQIRLSAGSFMNRLFRQGAFKGSSPREAYFVKCDAETTTPDDISLGVVNVLIGFAPQKPAEFVVLKVRQVAGQSPA